MQAHSLATRRALLGFAAPAILAGIMLSAHVTSAQVSVLTHHNDSARTGQNIAETLLTPTAVASGTFGRLFAYPVDGYVYAQPLYVPNLDIPGLGVRNVIFIATQHDSVYAFDADNGVAGPIWQVSFINPAAGITTVPGSDVNNTSDLGQDINPEIGITGTPVIDPASRTLYVVAKTKEIVNSQSHIVQRLHALDLVTGAQKFGGPAVIGEVILSAPFLSGGTTTYVSGPVVSGSTFDAAWNLDRAGLLLLDGVVYVAWASHGDSGNYHGWVTGHDAQTLGLVAAFNVSPHGALGGSWMGGGAPAVDAAGAIYISTGNGDFATSGALSPAYGETVLKLLPSTGLGVADYFTPFNQATLTANDTDLASGGVMVLPDQPGAHPHLMIAAGKEGKIYVINRDDMGNYRRCGATCDAVLQTVDLHSGVFGVPAYFNGRIYYHGAGDVVKAFQLTNGVLSTTPVSQTTNGWGFPGSSPSVSANGTANGIVWTVQVTGYKTGTPAVLHAYDAIDLTRELYNSSQKASDHLEAGVKFSTPTIANGKVYVGTQSTVVAYGMVSSGTLGAPSNLTATAVSTSRINLAWAASTGPVISYRVESCPGAGCTNFSLLAVGVAGTTYADTGLTAGTSYSYRVQANDAVGHVSGYSNTATATTPVAGDTTPPTNPSGLTATVASSSQVNTTWTASTDDVGVTGYLVERCPGSGCTAFAQIATVTATTYNDTGLAAGTTYSYRVRAVDAAGNLSGYSNTASATTSTSPPPIAFVQGNFASPQPPTATVTVTYTAAQLAGDLNVVIVGWNDTTSTVTSVNDTIGNFYALAVGPTSRPGPAGGGGLTQSIYYAKNILGAAAGTNTVTVRFSAAATFPDIRVLEYSGLDRTNPFDVGAGAVGTAVTADSGPATTTSAYELLVGGNMVWSVTVGPGTGYTSRMITSPDGDIAEDQIVSTIGSYRATAAMAGTGPWVMQMATFRGVGSAPPPLDTTPPTAPSGLTPTAASTTQINLVWTASTDNVGVTGYLVERCQGSGCTTFAQVASMTTTTFSNTGLTAATSYSYRVRATDAAGNLSGYSNTASASTVSTPDATPPTAPSGLAATTVSTTQINLAWAASADNVGVTGYLVERCQGSGCTTFAQITSVTTTTFSNTGLTGATSYSYRVRATDAAGNLSGYSNTVSASTVTTPDATPPTAPSGLVATAVSTTQINLAWAASADNVGVTGYLVERCQGSGCTTFAQITSVTTTTFSNTGLTGATSYSYRVRATDAAGNLSAYSSTATAVTQSTAPSIAFVQVRSTTPQSAQSTVTLAYSAAQRVGDLNVVVVGWNDASTTITSVTDTKGNIYVPAVGPTVQPGPAGGGGLSQTIYYARNIVAATANTNTVTVKFSAKAPFVDLRILEYSGVDSVNPLNGSSAAVGNSATADAGPLTTSNAKDLLVAANTVWTSTATTAPGFTARIFTKNGDIAEDRIVTATGAYTVTTPLNASGPWVMQMAAFKAAQ